MRKLVLLAALAASFVLYGNAANACANSGHVSVEQTIVVADAEFYFEQAAAARHNDHQHGSSTSCDGACCGCAASAASALPAMIELDHPAPQASLHRSGSSTGNPPQLTSDLSDPPKFFA